MMGDDRLTFGPCFRRVHKLTKVGAGKKATINLISRLRATLKLINRKEGAEPRDVKQENVTCNKKKI